MREVEKERFYVLFSFIEPDGLNSMLYITKLMRQTRLWLESILQINLKSVGKCHLGLKRALFFKRNVSISILWCALSFTNFKYLVSASKS